MKIYPKDSLVLPSGTVQETLLLIIEGEAKLHYYRSGKQYHRKIRAGEFINPMSAITKEPFRAEVYALSSLTVLDLPLKELWGKLISATSKSDDVYRYLQTFLNMRLPSYLVLQLPKVDFHKLIEEQLFQMQYWYQHKKIEHAGYCYLNYLYTLEAEQKKTHPKTPLPLPEPSKNVINTVLQSHPNFKAVQPLGNKIESDVYTMNSLVYLPKFDDESIHVLSRGVVGFFELDKENGFRLKFVSGGNSFIADKMFLRSQASRLMCLVLSSDAKVVRIPNAEEGVQEFFSQHSDASSLLYEKVHNFAISGYSDAILLQILNWKLSDMYFFLALRYMITYLKGFDIRVVDKEQGSVEFHVSQYLWEGILGSPKEVEIRMASIEKRGIVELDRTRVRVHSLKRLIDITEHAWQSVTTFDTHKSEAWF